MSSHLLLHPPGAFIAWVGVFSITHLYLPLDPHRQGHVSLVCYVLGQSGIQSIYKHYVPGEQISCYTELCTSLGAFDSTVTVSDFLGPWDVQSMLSVSSIRCLPPRFPDPFLYNPVLNVVEQSGFWLICSLAPLYYGRGNSDSRLSQDWILLEYRPKLHCLPEIGPEIWPHKDGAKLRSRA